MFITAFPEERTRRRRQALFVILASLSAKKACSSAPTRRLQAPTIQFRSRNCLPRQGVRLIPTFEMAKPARCFSLILLDNCSVQRKTQICIRHRECLKDQKLHSSKEHAPVLKHRLSISYLHLGSNFPQCTTAGLTLRCIFVLRASVT
jgi:hypothetical protein